MRASPGTSSPGSQQPNQLNIRSRPGRRKGQWRLLRFSAILGQPSPARQPSSEGEANGNKSNTPSPPDRHPPRPPRPPPPPPARGGGGGGGGGFPRGGGGGVFRAPGGAPTGGGVPVLA